MSNAVVCPYCRMPFADIGPPKIFCTACGVPHHEDCYQENGGCTVFGCARAPADDPKLQVSYSDLNAVSAVTAAAARTAASPAAQRVQVPSRYNDPPAFPQPAAAAAAFPLSQPARAPSLPDHIRPERVLNHQRKSRTTYVVLGIFLGALGVHNFYAGYTGRAIGQLCLSVLTLFTLALLAWIWAIVEICVVDKDSAGIQFS